MRSVILVTCLLASVLVASAEKPNALMDTFRITANALQTARSNFITSAEQGKVKLSDFIKKAEEDVKSINGGNDKIRNICGVMQKNMDNMDQQLNDAMLKIVKNIVPAYRAVVQGIIEYLSGGQQ